MEVKLIPKGWTGGCPSRRTTGKAEEEVRACGFLARVPATHGEARDEAGNLGGRAQLAKALDLFLEVMESSCWHLTGGRPGCI